MENLALTLMVTLATLTFMGCKKKAATVENSDITVYQTERVSGPFAAETIVWEEEEEMDSK